VTAGDGAPFSLGAGPANANGSRTVNADTSVFRAGAVLPGFPGVATPRPPRYHSASFVPPLHRAATFRRGNPGATSPTMYPHELRMKTFSAKNETVQRDWYVVDAEGKTLGRLASELARRLRGKHKPVYTPHVDTGDYLVVINAEKVAVTGNKLQDKMYHRFTGYIGNLKSETLAQALERHPERVLETAVKGMLPKNPLGRAMYRKLKVYAGPNHPHTAQQPQPLEI
jgi:large subunit ribosomal protein L13